MMHGVMVLDRSIRIMDFIEDNNNTKHIIEAKGEEHIWHQPVSRKGSVDQTEVRSEGCTCYGLSLFPHSHRYRAFLFFFFFFFCWNLLVCVCCFFCNLAGLRGVRLT